MPSQSVKGCGKGALSPLLYVLSLEPMLNHLRGLRTVRGIDIKGKVYKLAAFRNLSNLKIIFGKSTALNVSLQPGLVHQCELTLPFRWQRSSVPYLGINLLSSLQDLYTLNFVHLLHTITADLQRWKHSPLSWFGRAATVKMNVLPRILYLLQTIPIALPKPFFASLRKLVTDFIWGGGKARIGFSTLVLPKARGE